METTRDKLSAAVLTIAAVAQIALAIALYDSRSDLITNIGWGVLWVSALFGWWPMLTMRKHGGVPAGESYMATTTVVDRGPFAIVRHPQYLAGILMAVALPLIAQHWLVALVGVVVIATLVEGTYGEERRCLAKWPEAYARYQQRVPRLNFLWGIVRWLGRLKS